MTAGVATAPAPRATPAVRRLFRDHPLIPLTALLVALVVVLELVQPGTLSPNWVAIAIRAAIPLAILAGCQTMTMLTGGIDLSVGTVATMSAFIVATQAPIHDPAIAVLIALVPGVLIGLANGIGVGVFRVHPLIMTLGTSLIGTGVLQVYQRTVIATGTTDAKGYYQSDVAIPVGQTYSVVIVGRGFRPIVADDGVEVPANAENPFAVDATLRRSR
jgi:ribose transport system permease protein